MHISPKAFSKEPFGIVFTSAYLKNIDCY